MIHQEFLDNKYTRWYYTLIERRQKTPASSKGGYREDHHITPESFYINRKREGPAGWLEGNPDAKENKVWLTGREHALCHWLLVKMTTGVAHIKCRQAFDMMASDNNNMNRKVSRMITRAYERNRIEVAKIRSERMLEVNPMDNAESRKKVSDSKRGKPRGKFTPEWSANLSASRTGEKNPRYGKPVKDSSRQLIKEKAKLRRYSDETNTKRRDASSGRKEITDGSIYKKVKLDELQSWLDQGWIVKGKPRTKKQAA